jgi:hypothetical protein
MPRADGDTIFLVPRPTGTFVSRSLHTTRSEHESGSFTAITALRQAIMSEREQPDEPTWSMTQRPVMDYLTTAAIDPLSRLHRPSKDLVASRTGFFQTSFHFGLNGLILGKRLPLVEIQNHNGIIDVFRGYWIDTSLGVRLFMGAGVRIRYRASGGKYWIFWHRPYRSRTGLSRELKKTVDPRVWPKDQVLVELFGVHPDDLPAEANALDDRFILLPRVGGKNIQDVVQQTLDLCQNHFNVRFFDEVRWVEPIYVKTSPLIASRYYQNSMRAQGKSAR